MYRVYKLGSRQILYLAVLHGDWGNGFSTVWGVPACLALLDGSSEGGGIGIWFQYTEICEKCIKETLKSFEILFHIC